MTEQTQRRSIAIDIVSDAVCPWCYIGKRNLEAALADLPDLDVDVRWRPYQLDPTIPAEGLDRRAYMQRKFGSRIDEIHQRLKQAGDAAGLDFAFEAIERSPNTLDAHRLIRYADRDGKQDAVVEALFQAYFTQGMNIGDPAALVAIAAAAGLDGAAVAAYLASDEDLETIQAEDAFARQIGIQGVPCFIIERKYAISGAQPPEAFIEAFEKIRAEA